MPGLTVRQPREEEAPLIAELHLKTWAEAYAGKFPATAWGEKARTAPTAMWESICSAPRPGDRFAVAVRDNELVGFAGAGASQDEPAPRNKQLWFIYLLAAEHGSGAGQALLDEVLGDAPASLWVLDDNPRAKSFYARNGFRPDGKRQPSGYETAGDEIRMVR